MVFKGNTSTVASYSPFPYIISISCTLYTDTEMACACGTSPSEDPSPAIYLFSFITRSWTMLAKYASFGLLARDRCSITQLGFKSLLLFGGNYYQQLNNAMLKVVSGKITQIRPHSIVVPSERCSTALFYHANRVILFNGVGAMHSLNLRTTKVVFPHVWELPLDPICTANTTESCYQCAPGTYEYKGKCISCVQGKYTDTFGASSCKNWYNLFASNKNFSPEGFFGYIDSADSSNLCLPCPFGSFASTTGQRQCFSCPANTTCIIGATSPFAATNSTKVQLVTIQPSAYKSNESMLICC